MVSASSLTQTRIASCGPTSRFNPGPTLLHGWFAVAGNTDKFLAVFDSIHPGPSRSSPASKASASRSGGRRGADFTFRFPTIAEAVRGLPADQALIDGEAVVLRKDGRSDFGALLIKRGGAEATLMAFDLLRLDGDDLRLKPLEARREALRRLVAGVNGILFSEALASEGAAVFAKACELDLEGIVSKREGSFYRCGRSRNWLKAKNPDFVRT